MHRCTGSHPDLILQMPSLKVAEHHSYDQLLKTVRNHIANDANLSFVGAFESQ